VAHQTATTVSRPRKVQAETAPTPAGSPAERSVAAGKAARQSAPLESHGEFAASKSRDPIGLLLSQDEARVPELVPVRHGRMMVSPFTYYRGAALPMAADLAHTPLGPAGAVVR
jgi:hypothetical protein